MGRAGCWKKYDPNEPFEYTFLDDQFPENYEADNRLAGNCRLFHHYRHPDLPASAFSGWAAFSAEQRTKEIGVT